MTTCHEDDVCPACEERWQRCLREIRAATHLANIVERSAKKATKANALTRLNRAALEAHLYLNERSLT